MRWVYLLVVVAAISGFSGAAGPSLLDRAAQAFFLPDDANHPPKYAVETLRDRKFTTPDGIALVADVFKPAGMAKAPTILVRIPFSRGLWNEIRSDVVARYWAARGYAVVIQGTRGRYKSEGVFEPLIYERDDGVATLAWLAAQPWYDGRVAMWGGSAFGHTQWAVSDQPAPKAYFIQIASTSFESFFHPGGAFALESALYWALNSHGAKDQEVKYPALDRGLRTLPVTEADSVASHGDIPFFDKWTGGDAEYWRRVDGGGGRAENTAAPALLLGGWYDPFLPAMLKDYAALRANPKAAGSRIIIGPFGHARTITWPGAKIEDSYRKASIAPALDWFDYQLGVSAAPLRMAPVRIFVLGENVWRDEQEWPLARTRFTPMHLAPGGVLSSLAPKSGEVAERFVFDPANPVPTAGGAMLGKRSGPMVQRAAGARSDVLSFTGAALTAPMEITGPISAVLYVSTDAPSTDFTAKLIDVFPDGAAYNLADGIVRRTYIAGEKTRIEIDMGAISVLMPVGHRLRLDISSSNFPRFDRNPNTGESPETATRFVRANQSVWLSGGSPSQVIVPVAPR